VFVLVELVTVWRLVFARFGPSGLTGVGWGVCLVGIVRVVADVVISRVWRSVVSSGVISVTPEQLRQQARVYLEARAQIDEANAKVRRMNSEIGQQWRGQAFQAYLNQYQELEGYVRKFKDLLRDINRQLNTYAQTIAERDREDATRFGLS
jgi:WXG100 family type VII secretion target